MNIKPNICFGVIGGDLRQACLADILSSDIRTRAVRRGKYKYKSRKHRGSYENG